MFFVVSLFQSFKVNKCIFHLNIDEITSFYIIHCKHVFNMHQSRTHEIFVKTMLLNIIIINFTGFFLFFFFFLFCVWFFFFRQSTLWSIFYFIWCWFHEIIQCECNDIFYDFIVGILMNSILCEWFHGKNMLLFCSSLFQQLKMFTSQRDYFRVAW